MSQIYKSSTSGSIPTNVAIDFVTDSGTATPVANVLNIIVGPGVGTTGSGNTVTVPSFSPNKVINDFDDFISDGEDTGKFAWVCVQGSITPIDGTSTHPGIVSVESAASPIILIFHSDIDNGSTFTAPFALGQGSLNINFVLDLATLSTVANRYTIYLGLFKAGYGPATVPTDGCYFKYTDTVNGGNWQIETMSSSVPTTANTSTPAAIGFHNYGIQVNAAATSVAFTIDGVVVANSPLTTNIPTAPLTVGYVLNSTSGNTPVTLVDLFYYTQILNTAR